ncbi:hypothetical protein Misp01_04390 [Microtetraspora sp. NBRC 13810]|uniref:hypothetical protein n=1 Tax=Microtetraspora sp. NBRC 13810 TaxID=3030990 RepID=UPI0024A1F019|nr:hypothetical protein [Microtetraspora sp. NBRC 13810]GLW05309.1 hypothetical protein Misp01_04390 [Microtetraspora sp. NBRC 13810]
MTDQLLALGYAFTEDEQMQRVNADRNVGAWRDLALHQTRVGADVASAHRLGGVNYGADVDALRMRATGEGGVLSQPGHLAQVSHASAAVVRSIEAGHNYIKTLKDNIALVAGAMIGAGLAVTFRARLWRLMKSAGSALRSFMSKFGSILRSLTAKILKRYSLSYNMKKADHWIGRAERTLESRRTLLADLRGRLEEIHTNVKNAAQKDYLAGKITAEQRDLYMNSESLYTSLRYPELYIDERARISAVAKELKDLKNSLGRPLGRRDRELDVAGEHVGEMLRLRMRRNISSETDEEVSQLFERAQRLHNWKGGELYAADRELRRLLDEVYLL